MMRRRSSKPVAVLLRLLLAVLPPFLVGANLSSEFRLSFDETVLIDGLDSPTDLAFSPDGSLLLVSEQGGNIYAVANFDQEDADETVEKWKVADLADEMCHNGSRGLVGIAIHPRYPSADGMWVYVFYTADSGDCYTGKWDVEELPAPEGTINRLSRFPIVLSSDGRITLNQKSEDVLLETAVQMSHLHNGGDIQFGNDGMLYLTLGDGSTNKLKNDDGKPFEQAWDVLFGKIVRLTPEGTIPEDNPYTPANGYNNAVFCGENNGYSGSSKKPCAEIYASGLRNPFRFAFDPNVGKNDVRFFINDVGGSRFERILEGKKGANYGYPDIKGPCSHESEAGGKCETPEELGFDPSVHWYRHDEEKGACITGGAFIPSDIGWPSDFDGTYLYGEYKLGGIYRIKKGGNGCPDCKTPVSDYLSTTTEFSDATAVVSMSFGPYLRTSQALYYLTRGSGRGSNEKGRPEGLVRIAHLGAQQTNEGPLAVIDTDVTIGFTPFTVRFDGTGSTDPDGEDNLLSFEWDFDGDGSTDSTVAKTKWVYSTPGIYEASLTVTDSGGATDKVSIDITVDNAPPAPVIENPSEDAQFAVGDVIQLVGSATDSVDGALPASSLTWEIRENHGDHYHIIMEPTTGSKASFEMPGPLDFESIQSSYLEAILTATDSRGLSSTTVQTLTPRKVSVNLESSPTGLDVMVFGQVVQTPTTVVVWERQEFDIKAIGDESGSHQFKSWSDGGDQSHLFTADPSGSLNVIAYFEAVEEPTSLEEDAEKEEEEETKDTPAVANSDADADTSIAELLDFSIIINLADSTADSDGSRRLGGSKQSPVISYLNKNLKDVVAEQLWKEMRKLIRSSGLHYAKPNDASLARKKRKVHKDGERYKAIFGGTIRFKKLKEHQRFPENSAVESLQMQVLPRVSDNIVDIIKESVPGARVSSVVIKVDGEPQVAPQAEDDVEKSEDFGGEDSSNKKNFIIVVGGSVVASVSIIAIGLFAFLITRSRHKPAKKEEPDDVNLSGATDDTIFI